MAVIETKYSVGERVWHSGTTTEAKQHPCPDCLGKRAWQAVSPAGDEFTFTCPRCSASYSSFDKQSLSYTAHVPTARQLTVGSVRHESETAFGRGPKTQYMCVETGVGSGTLYDEDRLFANEADAHAHALLLAAKGNESGWIAERFNKTLSVSDYQLSNGRLKEANELLTRAGSFFWNINDLFESIQNAADKDEIVEAVSEYREWHLNRDLERVAQAIEARSGETGTGSTEGESAVGTADAPNPSPSSPKEAANKRINQ